MLDSVTRSWLWREHREKKSQIKKLKSVQYKKCRLLSHVSAPHTWKLLRGGFDFQIFYLVIHGKWHAKYLTFRFSISSYMENYYVEYFTFRFSISSYMENDMRSILLSDFLSRHAWKMTCEVFNFHIFYLVMHGKLHVKYFLFSDFLARHTWRITTWSPTVERRPILSALWLATFSTEHGVSSSSVTWVHGVFWLAGW